MAASVFKSSNSFAKFTSFPVYFGVVLLTFGCATQPGMRDLASSDAPHNTDKNTAKNLDQKAQAAWETHPYTASPDYHFTLAQAYSTDGQVDRAIEELKAAIAYDANSSVLHAKLAAEYLKKGSTSFAIEECKRAIALDPTAIDVRLMLGGVYSIGSESDSALAEYEAILKLDPKNDEAAVFKTQVLVEQNKQDDALKFIRKFTAKVDDSAAAWFYAGKLEHAKEHVNEAIKDYRKALDLRPGFTQATIALGVIFEVHGETAKALELYQDQLEQKQDIQVASRLATLYLKLNQTDLALKTLEVMTVLDPDDLNTQLKIGLVEMQKQDWESAKKTFEAILVKVPDSDKVNYYLAAVYEEQGKYENAIALLKKVSADSKLFEDANLHASSMYRRLQQQAKAHEVLESAIQKSPENTSFYVVLASMFEDEKDLKMASKTLADGIKVFPEDEKLHYFHGAILDKMGMQDEAVVEMEGILKRNPDHADALNYVAYTWTSQGVHLKDAEDMLKRALKLKPDSPFILDSMGWNQFMLGHNQSALVFLEKAASLKADEQAILEHLVEVYARNEMPERAQATKNRIQQLSTGFTPGAIGARSPASVGDSK